MFKKILPAIIPMAFGIVLLSSCSTLKSLDLFNRKQNALVTAAPQETKFINDITVTPQVPVENTEVKSGPKVSFTTGGLNVAETQEKTDDTKNFTDIVAVRKNNVVENASSVQIKYAGLLKTDGMVFVMFMGEMVKMGLIARDLQLMFTQKLME
jgi:hypothetical protein